MNLAIINYGMGNLASISRVCAQLGATVILASNPSDLSKADRIILPGVGSFAEGMMNLESAGWKENLYEHVLVNKKPLLGICLGMQLLASMSEEGGQTQGFNLIPGNVYRLDKLGCKFRVPHVGWNDIKLNTNNSNPLFEGIPNKTDFYFVHSYAVDLIKTDYLSAYVEYDIVFTAAIASQHIFGVQFHPEKSSIAGRRLLQNFLNYKSC